MNHSVENIRYVYLLGLSTSLLNRYGLLNSLGDSVPGVDGGVAGESVGLEIGTVVVVGNLGGDGLRNSAKGLVQRRNRLSLAGLRRCLGRLGRQGGALVGSGGNVDGLAVEAGVLVGGDVLHVALLDGEADGAAPLGPAVDLPHEAGVVLGELPDESIAALNHFLLQGWLLVVVTEDNGIEYDGNDGAWRWE